MRFLLPAISLFLLISCSSPPQQDTIPQEPAQPQAEEASEPGPRSSIPLAHQLPKTSSWQRCAQYYKMFAEATYKMGHKDDSPLLYMAQGRQESLCKDEAESHVGAQSIMQIMPRTAQEIRQKWKHGPLDVWDAGSNIRAGVWYDQRVRAVWNPDYRSYCERVWLMLGGYNSGAGHWINAQKACNAAGRDDCNSFEGIAEFVPQVNSVGAHENLTYIERISKGWNEVQKKGTCPVVKPTRYLE